MWSLTRRSPFHREWVSKYCISFAFVAGGEFVPHPDIAARAHRTPAPRARTAHQALTSERLAPSAENGTGYGRGGSGGGGGGGESVSSGPDPAFGGAPGAPDPHRAAAMPFLLPVAEDDEDRHPPPRSVVVEATRRVDARGEVDISSVLESVIAELPGPSPVAERTLRSTAEAVRHAAKLQTTVVCKRSGISLSAEVREQVIARACGEFWRHAQPWLVEEERRGRLFGRDAQEIIWEGGNRQWLRECVRALIPGRD